MLDYILTLLRFFYALKFIAQSQTSITGISLLVKMNFKILIMYVEIHV
jgi:hypothetical protein